jgi:hypothetical protein
MIKIEFPRSRQRNVRKLTAQNIFEALHAFSVFCRGNFWEIIYAIDFLLHKTKKVQSSSYSRSHKFEKSSQHERRSQFYWKRVRRPKNSKTRMNYYCGKVKFKETMSNLLSHKLNNRWISFGKSISVQELFTAIRNRSPYVLTANSLLPNLRKKY